MTKLFVSAETALLAAVTALCRHVAGLRERAHGDRGQATAEYALVLLGAASVALLLIAWAAKSGKINRLLDAVVNRLLDQV